MSRFIIRTLIGASAALALDVSAHAAGFDAYSPDERVAVQVKATDAELHSAAGAKTLALRIRVAADDVCGANVDPIVRTGDQFMRCREAAIDGAIRNLDSPLVADALGRAPRALARSGR